ncbi:MAG: hypothetical protein ACI4FY_07350 [Acetatifactor sp.]
MKEEKFPYEDILHRSRPVSEKHPPMDRANRAAQFSPFAALTGYEEAIQETARLTDTRIELDEGEKEQLDAKLAFLLQATGERRIRVTYFEPDPLKEGGSYVTEEGVFRKLDPVKNTLLLDGQREIPFSEVIDLSGDVLDQYEMT